ncbi:MAG: DUF3445 domain-containing protein [Pseudomonadota bacterium]
MSQQEIICQSRLPVLPWMDAQLRRLPGLLPIKTEDWLLFDEAYAAQMALRDRLISDQISAVFACETEADRAASELLNLVLDDLNMARHFSVRGTSLTRPDGVVVEIGAAHPLITVGRLVQNDFALLLPGAESHHLAAAILCFPAGWILTEKLGRPLSGVHQPVDEINAQMDNRIERMLHALQPGQTLMRANTLIYTDPTLPQPRREGTHKQLTTGARRYVRVERQTLRKLPESEAVAFGIHTAIVPANELPSEAYAALIDTRPELGARHDPIE